MTTGSSTHGNVDGGGLLPGVGRPVGDEDPLTGLAPQESLLHFLSRTLWWMMPVVLVVIGAMLGWADKSASNTDIGLRFPALIAALLLFSQGLADLKAGRKRSVVGEVRFEVGAELYETELELGRTRAELSEARASMERARMEGTEEGAREEAPKPVPEPDRAQLSLPSNRPGQDRAMLMSLGLMLLGVWLGVKVLTVPAPASLTVLSLIAVFLVFSGGARTVMPES